MARRGLGENKSTDTMPDDEAPHDGASLQVDAEESASSTTAAKSEPAHSSTSPDPAHSAPGQSSVQQSNTAHQTANEPRSSAQGAQAAYSLLEVAKHLQVSPDTLRSWNQRFGQLLASDLSRESPRYSSADVAVLLTIQKLIEQRMSDEEVVKQLMPRRIEPESTSIALAAQRAGEISGDAGVSSAAQALSDVLGVIAGSQQSVLNSQSSMREMVTVVVQDNFNLKDENRKLRDRMLELERALAEYQRREETRKERMEARMRALEGTVAALQQQMAQFVQLQRAQAKKKGFW